MCCCKPANLFHDEAIKFVLKVKHESVKDTVIFRNYKEGQIKPIQSVNNHIPILNSYSKKMLIGRHQAIYSCVEKLFDTEGNRIIQIKGDDGLGKMDIAYYAI